jgi:hypothetical protein
MYWAHVPMQQAKKIKMYTKLPTYKMVVVDQCFRNSELLSHLPFIVYMS